MTACLSFLYVKKYGGKLYVRIEDTNPENIYSQAYEMIEDESRWLFDDIAKFVIQSDRINLYYEYAEKLIEKKAAYVCTCSQEKFKEFTVSKKNCPCR
jgi:glutamyl-tRNA synthetase